MTKFKKILAISAIFSVFTLSGNANTALASSCPYHGSYWEHPTITNLWTTTHKVLVDLSGGVAEVICTVSHQGYIKLCRMVLDKRGDGIVRNLPDFTVEMVMEKYEYRRLPIEKKED